MEKSEQFVELRNGLRVPILGLGTSLRGKPKIENQAFIESVKHAIQIGYRHIDTAKCYNNEQMIGNAIKESGVNREDLFIVTKLYPEDMGYEKTLKAFAKSCERLQVDYVDLYLIHFPGLPSSNSSKVGGGGGAQRPYEKAREMRLETWRALEKLYNDGKCKSIGVSNYMKKHLDEIVEANMSLPMVNQCEFHVYYNNKDVFETCKQMGIQFEGYSPLGKGNLLNDPAIVSIANKYDKTPAQIALKWSVMNKVITIPGSTNHTRIRENFEIFDFELDQAEFDLLWTLNRNEKVSWDPTNVI